MLLGLATCLLVLHGPDEELTDRERAALAVLRVETVAERKRQLDRRAVVGFGGEPLREAEWSIVRARLARDEPKGPPKLSLRSLEFRQIDRLAPDRYRVVARSQTHPPGPPVESTFVVVLTDRGDRLVGTASTRELPRTAP